MQPIIKPGYKTSEFYLSLTTSIVGLFITLGYLTPQQGDDLVKGITTITGGIAMIVPVIFYIYTRYVIKRDVVSSVKESVFEPTAPVLPTITPDETEESPLPLSTPSLTDFSDPNSAG